MRILIFFISVIGISFQPVSTNQVAKGKYFDLASFTQILVENQVVANTHITKTTNVNGVEEIIEIGKADSLFWTTELFLLLNANINKPSLIDSYSIEKDINEETSNLLKTIYTALPEAKTEIKKIEFKYLNTQNEIRQVLAVINTKNSVYSTKQTVEMWVNKYGNKLLIDSLVTTGYNKTILLDSMRYSSKVVVRKLI